MTQSSLMDFDSRQDSLFVLKKSNKKTTQAESVLWAFANSSDGATDGEVAEILGIERTSVIARRHDLIKKYPDLFYCECKRVSRSGVACDVWKTKK